VLPLWWLTVADPALPAPPVPPVPPVLLAQPPRPATGASSTPAPIAAAVPIAVRSRPDILQRPAIIAPVRSISGEHSDITQREISAPCSDMPARA
jgi:hypothetical protein